MCGQLVETHSGTTSVVPINGGFAPTVFILNDARNTLRIIFLCKYAICCTPTIPFSTKLLLVRNFEVVPMSSLYEVPLYC